MGNSKIPWLKNPDGSPGKTWSLAEGCTKVSTGCLNCCAERVFNRWHPGVDFRQVRVKPEHLEDPLHWKKPQRILVDFMFDLFHPQMLTQFIADVFAVMAASKQHTFLILTKRPEIMKHFITFSGHDVKVEQSLEKLCDEHGWCPPDFEWPVPNVWLGVSVEDQATADNRIPYLLSTPSALRFISYEPALGPVDFWPFGDQEMGFATEYDHRGTYPFYQALGWENKSIVVRPGIDWLIMGCESGPGARPMDIEWERSARNQCESAGIPFFFKQQIIDGKLIHMPDLDGKVWDEFPKA